MSGHSGTWRKVVHVVVFAIVAGALGGCATQRRLPAAIDAYNHAITLGESGNFNGAYREYTRAIQIDPRFTQAYYNRGNVSLQRGNYTAAIADYTRAIALDSDNSWAYNNRGNAYYKIGKKKKALKDYYRAVEEDSDSAVAYFNRGLTIYELHGLFYKDVDPYDDFTRAIKLNPSYVDAYFNRARYADDMLDFLAFVGDEEDDYEKYSHSIADYSRVIALRPNDADAYFYRAENYSYSKKTHAAARRDWEKVIRLVPGTAIAKKARKQLDKLKKK